jgi:hypothetical protein
LKIQENKIQILLRVIIMDQSVPQISFVDTESVQNRHRPAARRFTCSICSEIFLKLDEYFTHLQSKHECECGIASDSLESHHCQAFPEAPQVGTGRVAFDIDYLNLGVFKITRQAHEGAVISFTADFNEEIKTFEDAFEYVFPSVHTLLGQLVSFRRGIKMSNSISCTLEQIKSGDIIQRVFVSPFITLTNTVFIKSRLETALKYLTVSLSLYQEGKSGWRLRTVHYFELRTLAYKPDLRRGRGYIPTPPELNRCKIINIKSEEENCFMLHVIAGLYRQTIRLPEDAYLQFDDMNTNQRRRYKKLLEKSSSYHRIFRDVSKRNEIDFERVKKGVALVDIPHFEAVNQISINVFEYKDKALFPSYVTQIRSNKQVNLLLLSQEKDGETKYHYTLITNLGAFSQKSSHRAMEACFYCFQRYRPGKERHKNMCLHANDKRITFPKEQFAVFDQYQMFLPVNFKIIFTFVVGTASHVIKQETLKYTTVEGNSKLLGFGMVVFDCDHELQYNGSYYGPAAMERFVQTLVTQVKRCDDITSSLTRKMSVSAELKEDFTKVVQCGLCLEKFDNRTQASPASSPFEQ